MSDLLDKLDAARSHPEAFNLNGLLSDAISRLAKLEAENARLREDPIGYANDAYEHEIARLREALNRLERECGSELLRLHRIEEAARAVCDWTLMSVDQHQAAKMQGYLRTALKEGEHGDS